MRSTKLAGLKLAHAATCMTCTPHPPNSDPSRAPSPPPVPPRPRYTAAIRSSISSNVGSRARAVPYSLQMTSKSGGDGFSKDFNSSTLKCSSGESLHLICCFKFLAACSRCWLVALVAAARICSTARVANKSCSSARPCAMQPPNAAGATKPCHGVCKCAFEQHNTVLAEHAFEIERVADYARPCLQH